MSKKKILLLPGDGIGLEISKEAEKVFQWIENNSNLQFEINKESIGGESIDRFDEPLTKKVLDSAFNADAILLGAVGGPKWEKLSFEKRPERGLLKIRKELDLFANFRPAIVFNALKESSSLKENIILNSNPKKSFPGSFLLFIAAAIPKLWSEIPENCEFWKSGIVTSDKRVG